MLVGFSQVRFDDAFDYRMGGTFVNYMRSETEFHTPLFCSAWAVKAGDNSFVWVSCDVARFMECDADYVREKVEKEIGIPKERVLVSATHNHTGPTARPSISPYFPTGDLSYFEKLGDKAAEACVQAWNNLTEATMSYARCDEDKCVHNRRYLMDTGESMMEPGGPEYPGRLMKEGPEDTELQAVWFMKEGKPVGIIVNYSSHPSELYAMKYTSGDYPGVLRRVLQNNYGADVPIVFLQGCCGNLTPRDHEHDATWGHGIDGAERVGTIIAADVMRMIALTRETSDVTDIHVKTTTTRLNLREVSEEDLKRSDEVFELLETDRPAFDALDVADKGYANKVRNLLKKWEVAPYEDVPIGAVKLGDVIFLTHPAELFCEYQLDMKKQLGAKTICVELTNGGICYVATKQGYVLKGYEMKQGFYDYHAGQKIEDSLIELSREMGH
ncbi:MAG: hypothetical protein E7403_03795 [Ruminococcaceae bacterium]|nr:hypothetical protein [Oscillospiraceae bacterium]